MDIVPFADVAQRADKAAVSRAVIELAFDPAVAIVENSICKSSMSTAFAALWASSGMIAAHDLKVSPRRRRSTRLIRASWSFIAKETAQVPATSLPGVEGGGRGRLIEDFLDGAAARSPGRWFVVMTIRLALASAAVKVT
jgi:hypothetical protein